MVQTSDHLTPATGLTGITVTISKNGGSFATPSGSISEVGSGWYAVAGNSTDSNTLGELIVHASHASADIADRINYQVVPFDPDSAVLGLNNIAAADVWAVGTRTLTSGANIALAKGTGVTGFNDIAATAIVSGGAINTSGGAVTTVTNVTNDVGITQTAADKVWSSVARTLTANTNLLAAADVWSAGTRTLTAGDNITLAKGTGITGFNDITVASIWAAAVRTLTANTNLNDITAADVWSYVTRVLTSGTNIALAKGTGVTGFNDIAATDVWSAGTRTLTSGANIVLAKDTGVTGFNDLSSTDLDNLLAEIEANFPENSSILIITDDGHIDTVDNYTDNTPQSGDAYAQLSDIYTAKIDYTVDGANDEYTVVWFKNGNRVTSGVTLPKIQVIRRSDGTDLIAESAMTQIGSLAIYKFDSSTQLGAGEAAIILVKATIDAAQREWTLVTGRDASA